MEGCAASTEHDAIDPKRSLGQPPKHHFGFVRISRTNIVGRLRGLPAVALAGYHNLKHGTPHGFRGEVAHIVGF